VAALLERRGERMDELRHKLERDVRYANITIIEGHDASQYGIGMVSARIAEMVLNDERAVVPIGSYQKQFGVTLSLPSVVGRSGVTEVLEPQMSDEDAKGSGRARMPWQGTGARAEQSESSARVFLDLSNSLRRPEGVPARKSCGRNRS